MKRFLSLGLSLSVLATSLYQPAALAEPVPAAIEPSSTNTPVKAASAVETEASTPAVQADSLQESSPLSLATEVSPYDQKFSVSVLSPADKNTLSSIAGTSGQVSLAGVSAAIGGTMTAGRRKEIFNAAANLVNAANAPEEVKQRLNAVRAFYNDAAYERPSAAQIINTVDYSYTAHAGSNDDWYGRNGTAFYIDSNANGYITPEERAMILEASKTCFPGAVDSYSRLADENGRIRLSSAMETLTDGQINAATRTSLINLALQYLTGDEKRVLSKVYELSGPSLEISTKAYIKAYSEAIQQEDAYLQRTLLLITLEPYSFIEDGAMTWVNAIKIMDADTDGIISADEAQAVREALPGLSQIPDGTWQIKGRTVNFDCNGDGRFSSTDMLGTLLGSLPASPGISITTREDTAVKAAIPLRDAAGNALTYTVGELPAGMKVTFENTGQVKVTPPANTSGSYDIVLKGYNAATGLYFDYKIAVEISAVNDPPVVPAKIDLQASGAVKGTIPAKDADGDKLTFQIISANPGGKLAVNPKTGEYAFGPGTAYFSTQAFIVRVTDGKGGVTTITLTFYPRLTIIGRSLWDRRYSPLGRRR